MNNPLFDKTPDNVIQDHLKYLPDPSSSSILHIVIISLISGTVLHAWLWPSMVKPMVKYMTAGVRGVMVVVVHIRGMFGK